MDICIQIQFVRIFISGFVPLQELPAASFHSLSPGYNGWDLAPSPPSYQLHISLRVRSLIHLLLTSVRAWSNAEVFFSSFEKISICAEVGYSNMWPSGCPPGWPPSTCQAKPKHTGQSPGTVLPLSARVGDATEDAYVHPASLSSDGRQLQLLSGAHPAETCETFATNFYSNGSTSLTTYLKHHMQWGKPFPFLTQPAAQAPTLPLMEEALKHQTNPVK